MFFGTKLLLTPIFFLNKNYVNFNCVKGRRYSFVFVMTFNLEHKSATKKFGSKRFDLIALFGQNPVQMLPGLMIPDKCGLNVNVA